MATSCGSGTSRTDGRGDGREQGRRGPRLTGSPGSPGDHRWCSAAAVTIPSPSSVLPSPPPPARLPARLPAGPDHRPESAPVSIPPADPAVDTPHPLIGEPRRPGGWLGIVAAWTVILIVVVLMAATRGGGGTPA